MIRRWLELMFADRLADNPSREIFRPGPMGDSEEALDSQSYSVATAKDRIRDLARIFPAPSGSGFGRGPARPYGSTP